MSKMGLRQRMSAFQLQADSILNKPGRYIFSDTELAKEPIKWLKYLVMDKLGLEPIKKIENQIHRYAFRDMSLAFEKVMEKYNGENPNSNMTVIKLVPWNRGAQLKNFRIYSSSDVFQTTQKILQTSDPKEQEIWFCESSVSDEGFNLGGRITFPVAGKPNFMELVWFASPRMIESFSLSNFSYPYLRAARGNQCAEFNIELIFIPDNNRRAGLSDMILVEDFKKISRLISLKRDTIRVILQSLRGFGAKEVSFCFKVVDGDLTIIDWDTEIESTN